jgi:3D (Asp-Asp-Asp) domain-containing protein
MGSRIRIDDAGPYSGEYTVTDTGARVKGRHLDLFIADNREAMRFGRRHARVVRLDQP